MLDQNQRRLILRGRMKIALFVVILFSHGLHSVCATETFNVTSKATSGSQFTLYLPSGWKMAKSEEADSPEEHFLFEAPGSNSTYIFCRIEKCHAETALQKLKSAYDTEHRPFLSESADNTAYFDTGRFVAWQRAPSKGNVVVSATFFGEALYHFKFFVPRPEFPASKRVLDIIVDNVEVHGNRPQLTGVAPEKRRSLSEVEVNSLFDDAETPGNGKYYWMVVVAIVVVALFFIERTIRLRRHREEMAELDKQIAERKASAKKVIDARTYLNDAEAYTKSSIGKRR